MFEHTKTVLDTATIPHVDIDFMNNTHFEEVEMVKKLGELISAYQEQNGQSDKEAEEISKDLHAWLDHTKPHFERENELMQETGFPAYAIHFEEHEIALEKMASVIKTWDENKDIDLISDYVFTVWPAWFNTHVNSMDMITAKFAVMNGYST